MNVTVADRRPDTTNQSRLGIVDCDVHPYTKSPADLDQFLSERWRKHRQESVAARARRSPTRRTIRGCRRSPACAWTPIRRMARIPAPTCR